MDDFANLGRALATPQFILSLVMAGIFISIGIYFFTHTPSPITPPNPIPGMPQPPVPSLPAFDKMYKIIGGVFIAAGLIMPFAAWGVENLFVQTPLLQQHLVY